MFARSYSSIKICVYANQSIVHIQVQPSPRFHGRPTKQGSPALCLAELTTYALKPSSFILRFARCQELGSWSHTFLIEPINWCREMQEQIQLLTPTPRTGWRRIQEGMTSPISLTIHIYSPCEYTEVIPMTGTLTAIPFYAQNGFNTGYFRYQCQPLP